MKYNELTLKKHKTGKRVGRGISAGQGKTAGRGTKGQGARTGSSAKPGFEGGQNPIMQRLPKLPGFKSHRVRMENVYTGDLEQFGGKTVDAAVLAEAGLVSSAYVSVKLLNRGELTKKVTVKLQAASKPAVEALQAAGGSFEKTPRQGRPVTSTKKLDKKSEK
ncbi:MAG TPA: 50S ribosomal protein L15 [Candidatus Saccharimonadales bacterium]|nr:50S ribosomal protein L15 [Candidatus Saccharimonadales bacterium]